MHSISEEACRVLITLDALRSGKNWLGWPTFKVKEIRREYEKRFDASTLADSVLTLVPPHGARPALVEELHLFVAAIWWIARKGLATPAYGISVNGGVKMGHGDLTIHSLTLTPAGLATLEAGFPPFVMSEDFIERTLIEPESFPEGVVARLHDAQACLRAELGRAASVMLGLAFEVSIERASDELSALLALKAFKSSMSASERLERFSKVLGSHQPKVAGANDVRLAEQRALAVANQVREQRNAAAHRAAHEFDLAGCVELFAIGVRVLPVLRAVAEARREP